MKLDIPTFLDDYVARLHKRRRSIAMLQVTGKLEAYFVSDFISTMFDTYRGRYLPLTNVGRKGERKVDIAILEGDLSGKIRVVGLLDAKYFRNRHRAWPDDATDEISGSMKSLNDQMCLLREKETHAGWALGFDQANRCVFGLAFASFVSSKQEDQKKGRFLERIIAKVDPAVTGHDGGKADLLPVYEEEAIDVLGERLFCSLFRGLWRR